MYYYLAANIFWDVSFVSVKGRIFFVQKSANSVKWQFLTEGIFRHFVYVSFVKWTIFIGLGEHFCCSSTKRKRFSDKDTR